MFIIQFQHKRCCILLGPGHTSKKLSRWKINSWDVSEEGAMPKSLHCCSEVEKPLKNSMKQGR